MIYTNDQFRMEIMKYLDDHWVEKLTMEEVAAKYGYSPQYFNVKFRECFALPFVQYFTKLKLHRVAKEISEKNSLSNMAGLAGYSNAQSFSKAFRNEFGMSPKQFMESEMEIPDMPVCCMINGAPIDIAYMETGAMVIQGKVLYPVNGNHTDLKKEVGYYFDHIDKRDNLEEGEEWFDLWWHDEQFNTQYVIGKNADNCENVSNSETAGNSQNISNSETADNCVPLEEETEMPERMIRIEVQPDYYAVFRAHLTGGEGQNISDTMKKLVAFVFGEWYLANKKPTKRMGLIFEKYEKDQVSVYVPMYKRHNEFYEKQPKFKGAEAWITYIEENLTNELTVKSLAENFNYSERHFTDTFEMYYGIRPGRYIQKRRLYLAANELKSGEVDMDKIVEKYGFHSRESFETIFEEEFFCKPLDYSGEEYKVEDLQQYYSFHKKTMLVTYMNLDDISIVGKSVTGNNRYKKGSGDLIQTIAWALKNELFQEPYIKNEDRVVVWKTQTLKDIQEHICLVGSEIIDEKMVPAHSDEYSKMKITGGLYALIESMNPSDEETLAETYRMLYRCAFEGWLRENQQRVDLKRLTFVRYIHGKLYFFIPINA